MTEVMNNKEKNAGTKRDWSKKPATVTVHMGAEGVTIFHDGKVYDATNGDVPSMELIARNICTLCNIS